MALDYPPQLKAVKKAVVVQPVEMAKKLMDIREQLADEWKEDLKNIQVSFSSVRNIVSWSTVNRVPTVYRTTVYRTAVSLVRPTAKYGGA